MKINSYEDITSFEIAYEYLNLNPSDYNSVEGKLEIINQAMIRAGGLEETFETNLNDKKLNVLLNKAKKSFLIK
jgi:hypothetical protein